MYLNSDPMDRIGHKRHYKYKDNYQVKMPEGDSYFIDGNRQAFPHKINQHQYRSEIHDHKALELNTANEKFDNTFQKKNYDRSLDIHDIEGTQPGTLISKVVKNKDLAQNYSSIYPSQGQNGGKQQDALDNFLRQSQSGVFKDRRHFFEENNNRYQQQGNQNFDQNSQRYQSSVDSYNTSGQHLQRQGESDKQKKAQEIEERLRFLEMEEEKYKQEKLRQQQQQQQESDNEYVRQKYYDQIRKEQEEEAMTQQNQDDQIKLEKMRRLQELENEISGLRQNGQEEQSKFQNRHQMQNEQEQNIHDKYRESYDNYNDQKTKRNQNGNEFQQKREKKVQIREDYMQNQRQQAQENLENLNRQKMDREIAYKENQSSIYDNILGQQNQQANFKIDINGYPVYRQAKNYQRMNPTSLSYGSKNDYNSKQMSYGILDNRIQEKQMEQQRQESNRLNNNNSGNIYNPNIPLYKQNKEQSLRDLQKQQEIEQEQNRQYKDKIDRLKNLEQNRSVDQYQKQGSPQKAFIDPSIQYASEYKQTYKPEFEKSKPFGPFDQKYQQTRQVPPHYQHSSLNALGNIPNQPRDTVEIAKEIIKPPSAHLAQQRNTSNYKNSVVNLRQSQEYYGLQDRDGKERDIIEQEEKLRQYQRFDRENNQSISKMQTNYDMGAQRHKQDQYQKYHDGSQLMDKTNFGSADKNVSKIKLY